MSVVYTMERHHEALHLWREQEALGLKVVHLDFHCDMRGMLVDRRRGRAYRIRDHFSGLDQGNFLTHAVLEGRIDELRWVHDEPGGRADDIGTVKFESDLSAIPHRLMLKYRKEPGIPLLYGVVTAARWDGLHEDEHLDIDWDHFAGTDYPIESVPDRIQAFWDRLGDVVPAQTTICYSPEYSHPSREMFEEFATTLAERFGASLVHREPPATGAGSNRRSMRSYVPDSIYETARSTYHRVSRALKHRGVF